MHTSEYRAQNFWNFIFSIFFIGVLVVAILYMKEARGGYMLSVAPFDALIIALATFRITRLVVYDKITRWFRDLFMGRNGPLGTVADLLQCPWCIGIWASLVVVFCYVLFPWAWFIIFFLAMAGVGSFLQIVANAVGWKAESYKLEAQEKEPS
jgi:hypothetical protein